MSLNAELAGYFQRMASVLQLLGASRFRAVAYERAARAIEGLSGDVAELADDTESLVAIDGIGKDLAGKIVEYVQNGRVEKVEETLAQVPPGVLQLLEIPNLGPKTANTLWQQGGVESVEDLKAKLQSGELENLPRMGKKTLENLKHAIAFTETAAQRARLGNAMVLAEQLVEAMRGVEGVTRADYAGSLRRGKETIGDIDLLVACKDPEKTGGGVSEAFQQIEPVQEVLLSGPTKTSVRIEGGVQVDLRVIRESRYGAAMMYFTGSKEHNVQLRERSIRKKMRLNEYGLWSADADPDDPDARPLAAKTEDAIYTKLGLDWIPPEMREDRGEIAAAEKGELPKLLELKDIKAELHAHTTASDGVWSIEELAEAAKQRGFHTVAVTDHSQSQSVANGLNAERMRKHLEAIREAAKNVEGITILAGSEVDILGNGTLDYPDELLAELDIVVASPHVALQQEPDKATARLLKAIENPWVHIIGHPTGRLVGKREGLSPQMSKLIEAAAETQTAMEINANTARLDLRDTHARAAIEAGVMLAINTDAHAADHLDHLRYGVLTARRAWAQKHDVVNCLSAQKLKAWLKKKRKHMGVA